MLNASLVGLAALLVSEYGIRSRKAAIGAWRAGWRWSRTLTRAALWSVFWLLSRRQLVFLHLLFLAGVILFAEGVALVLRWRLREDVREGHQHGRVLTHLLPPLLSALYPAILWALLSGGDPVAPDASWVRIRPLALGTAAVALWAWSTFLVVSVVDLVRPEQVRDELTPTFGPGEVIGILERYLTFLLVLSGGLTAVGFVFAAKAAARFPQFEKAAFAEYFLIGSLSSVGIATLLGLVLRALPT
jgi:hypothetical protein